MQIIQELLETLKSNEQEMINLRRYFHQHPEISFQEKETSKYIQEFYKTLDCTLTQKGEGYGFVVDIIGGKPGIKVALRADFDALAVYEENDLSFKSQNPGVMHACGHDAHTAYIMILAKALIQVKEQLPGSIRIIHQPAEEVAPGGAKGMIEDGALEGVDHVFGVHVMTGMETGTIAFHSAETQTGRSNFTIELQGRGGHAAIPQISNDAIIAGCYFVTQLQTVVSRRVDPFDTATLTIGSFDGVGTFNAIKDSVTLKGDVRVMKESTREMIERQIRQMAKGLELTFGVSTKVEYDNNYPVLYNDKKLTEFLVEVLKKEELADVTEVVDLGPQTPSEDFSYYGQVVPSTFFYIGAHPDEEGDYPHHSPRFKLNEKSLLIAAQAVGVVTLHDLFKNQDDTSQV